jgi:large subunit ribosomal protein L22
MESKAIGKYIGVSVRKARIPADIVRGMKAVDALNTLKYMPKAAAIHVRKVLASAIANAVNVNGMSETALFIQEVKIDQGPTQRRMYFKGKGGYRFFHRPTSHITVVLRDSSAPKKSEKKSEAKVEKKEVVVAEKPVKKAVKSVKKSPAKTTKKVK